MFKSLIISALLMSSSFAFSQCLENLCVGQSVINSSNDVGSIVGIRDGRIIYRTNYNSGLESAPSGLSARIESPRFSVNKKVINDSNDEGTVLMAFADGRVQYRTAYNSSLVSRTLSPEVPVNGNLRAGVTVINNSNDVGLVKSVFENGKAIYQTNYNSNLVSTTLVAEVSELNGMRIGTRVLNPSNDEGQVKRIFADGRVSYSTNYNSNLVSRELVREVSATPQGVQTNTVVLNSSNDIGRVKHVYSDGRIQYSTNYNSNLVSNNLAYEVPDHARYLKNVEYASNRDIGEVVRFFSNSKIELKGDYDSICDELFEEVDEAKGARRDTEVVTPSGEAKVEKIFANAMARILDKDGDKTNVQILDSAKIESKGMRSTWLAILNQNLTSPGQKISLGAAILKTDYKKLLDLLKIDLSANDSRFNRDDKKRLNDHIDAELLRIQ